MNKILFTCFLFLSAQTCFSQSEKIKRELTAADDQALLYEVRQLLRPTPSIGFSINTADIYPLSCVKPAKRTSLEEIELTAKKLKGDFWDYSIYISMANSYKKLQKKEEGNNYYSKAMQVLNQEYDKHPHDSLYFHYGMLFFAANDLPKAIQYFEKAIEINPSDSVSAVILPLAYVFSDDRNKVDNYCKLLTLKFPNSISAHVTSAAGLILKQMFSPEMRGDTTVGYSKKTINEVVDLSFIEKGAKDHPENFTFQLLLNLSQSMTLLVKGTPLYSFEDRIFHFTDYDKDQLTKQETFYKTSLKNKKLKGDYDYILNKALGFVYVLKNENKKAIPHLQKTIELKTPQYSNFDSNPGEAYNLLIYARVATKDTALGKELLLKKIQLLPEIDPDFQNYISLYPYHIGEKKLELARKACLDALALNKACEEAYVGLMGISLLEKNLPEAEKNNLEAYSLNPENDLAFTFSAILYLMKRDYSSAHYCLNKAMLLNKQDDISKRLLKTYFEWSLKDHDH